MIHSARSSTSLHLQVRDTLCLWECYPSTLGSGVSCGAKRLQNCTNNSQMRGLGNAEELSVAKSAWLRKHLVHIWRANLASPPSLRVFQASLKVRMMTSRRLDTVRSISLKSRYGYMAKYWRVKCQGRRSEAMAISTKISLSQTIGKIYVKPPRRANIMI